MQVGAGTASRTVNMTGGMLVGSYYLTGTIHGGQPVVGIADTGSADFALASTICGNCGNASSLYNPSGAAVTPCSYRKCACVTGSQCFFDNIYADGSGFGAKVSFRAGRCSHHVLIMEPSKGVRGRVQLRPLPGAGLGRSNGASRRGLRRAAAYRTCVFLVK